MLEEWKDGKEEEYWNGRIVKWWKKLVKKLRVSGCGLRIH